ncbi:MAG: GDP-mannose pyrophosphatase NudK [Chloroflexi bacterium]|nr:GDP-mannose pyrophosphatase NudK [Chloroflexota bacterium]MCC6893655.1 GDP-mannose pyrophosphatase NudK [Anaerolineae bacterium]
MTVQKQIRIKQVETLSDDWYVLKKTTFEYQRRDGSWQTVSRETYDRGNGATILLYNTLKQTVILTRQFRFPAYVNQHSGLLIETCAGLLDQDDPVTSIQREAAEETGYHIQQPRKVFEAFMSPGSVTERLYFFIAEYQDTHKVNDGGGLPSDGEDIEVLEIPFNQALDMMTSGEIADGKTIMLLQHLALSGLMLTAEPA